MSLTLLEPIIVNTAATFTFANANVTSNLAAGNITITGVYTGNGSGLTNLTGANVTGTVANATFATTAGTVTTNAQPNITSVGLLSSLSVGPNSSVVLTGTSGFVRANAIQGNDGVAALYPAYDGVTGAVGVLSNLTVGIGAAGSITANGNVTANFFIGDGSQLTGITASTAATVTSSAQPNITSVGTLGNLIISGPTSLASSRETVGVKTGATGTVDHSYLESSVFWHSSVTSNFTANFTNLPTTNNYVYVFVLLVNQGATPYYPSAIEIAGTAEAIKWYGGVAPTPVAERLEAFTFSLIRISGSWNVTGQYTTYQ